MEYESSIRRFAPVSFRSPQHRPCDEIVGRFCLLYETGGDSDSLPPEPKRVVELRGKAIPLLEQANTLAPGRPAVVYPLVRFLVQAHRPGDAVSVARAAFAALDSANARMVLGFALNAEGRTDEAIAMLTTWMSGLSERERSQITNLRWLLDPKEGSRYQRLKADERRLFEDRAWAWADPLYLTPGNDAYADHLARYALTRMLAKRPSVANTEGWGDDMEQLTVRFGAPVLTTRSWTGGAMTSQETYSEHWDPALRSYVAPVLSKVFETTVRLDTIWPVDSLTRRSGQAPPSIRIMRVLQHQAAVFDTTFAVSGVVKIDTLTDANQVAGAVFLLDSALKVVARAEAKVHVLGDSLVFSAELPRMPAAVFYSAEVYDRSSRFAARARYRIEYPKVANEMALSSILLAQPFEAGDLPANRLSTQLTPLNRPAIAAGSRIGVYAEVSAPGGERRTVQVEIESSRVDRPGALEKAIGWIGNKVGLGTPRSPTRVGWHLEFEPGRQNALPVTVDLGTADSGRYRLTLTVTDPATGSVVTTQRELLVVKTPDSTRR